MLAEHGYALGALAVDAGRKTTLPGPGWYEATQQTFAGQWVLAGGSIEKLSKVLGHCSVMMTERYIHPRPDLFAERDLGTICLDLERVETSPVSVGQTLGSAPRNGVPR